MACSSGLATLTKAGDGEGCRVAPGDTEGEGSGARRATCPLPLPRPRDASSRLPRLPEALAGTGLSAKEGASTGPPSTDWESRDLSRGLTQSAVLGPSCSAPLPPPATPAGPVFFPVSVLDRDPPSAPLPPLRRVDAFLSPVSSSAIATLRSIALEPSVDRRVRWKRDVRPRTKPRPLPSTLLARGEVGATLLPRGDRGDWGDDGISSSRGARSTSCVPLEGATEAARYVDLLEGTQTRSQTGTGTQMESLWSHLWWMARA